MSFITEDDTLALALLGKKLVTAAQLEQVREQIDPYRFDTSLAGNLLQKNLISENDLADIVADSFAVPRMNIADEIGVPPVKTLPPDLSQRLYLLPIFEIGEELTVAMVGPPYVSLLKALEEKLERRIIPVVTTLSDFREGLRNRELLSTSLSSVEARVDIAQAESLLRDSAALTPEDLRERIPSLYELSDIILKRAVRHKASDVHLEPLEDSLRVRYRIDGVLREMARFARELAGPLVAVMKNRSGMDMFERSVTQDGRMDVTIGTLDLDIRTSTIPTINGEKMVMRILRKEDVSLSLNELGFSERNLAIFERFVNQPNGIILVTGPTGCGKTTTLYGALRERNREDINIITIENPVEYRLPSINQIQVNVDRNITFARALRAILRQDPDVILVGEIRDVETGRVAAEAALTGHLVLSTLHTNDAIGAIPRLLNMGVPPVWLGPSLIGVLAQRLVRRICPDCIEEHQPKAEILGDFGLAPDNRFVFFHGRGCDTCQGEGYRGRTAIHEVFIITDEVREQIFVDGTPAKIRRIAERQNFETMRIDGLKKALDGITTLEEVQRQTRNV
jgi:type IV pilus assembly protein PilB